MSIAATLEALAADRPQLAARARQMPNVVAAVQSASATTGVDFSYLLEKAAVESSLRPEAKARTSSATGLYQFIERTWLATVDKHGAKHGLGEFADAIQQDERGRPVVEDSELRREILDLRKNPRIAALMVAEFTQDNADYLRQQLGHDVGSTELYMAHFLGAQGAGTFLTAMADNPQQLGRDLFPAAAHANRNVFYDRDTGRPQTLQQIYNRFDAKFSDGDPEQLAAELRGLTGFDQPPPGVGRGDPLAGGPLSPYTQLALAALETPLERGRNGKTPYGSHRVDEGAQTQAELNEFQRDWLEWGQIGT